tara:strand:- start:313 stop:750 length:438 start_codon:yes stop_codon:yes gene_type:complete
MTKKEAIQTATEAIKQAAGSFTSAVDAATTTITEVVGDQIKALQAAKVTNVEIHATVHAAVGTACTKQAISKILIANGVRLRAERSDKDTDKSDNSDTSDNSDSQPAGITSAQILQLLENASETVQKEVLSSPLVRTLITGFAKK